ncbi:AgmX/PglI C-terminal domain-containing protein [Pseudobacteriovorax antillogorgiicola]|uniref:AgmX/PglI C-terminal domain-containing protein n=1 Tax=Pseudobacteriovorax antillogorgiicola TaxID=1513793 RepID=UPI001F3A3EAC|nr:AgmX/PglI C-terminal domain-containing protein [Pseudobacteriovorax antillogorgiicola]
MEVLQNGELLSKISRPFDKMGTIRLTSKPDGDLTAPFYPLPTDIDLIKITKRGAEVDLDPNWEGFTTFEGRIEDISSHRNTQYTHIMKKGDYGSIAYNDLRVLIRIGKERPKTKRQADRKPTGEYRGKIFNLWIGEKRDFQILAIGFLAAAWLFGSFTLALLKRPDTRPKNFFDLQPVYTLPFIHPKHLALLPEALQLRLDRTDLIGSSFEYYMNLASTILGFSSRWNPAIYKSTYNMYEDLHRDQKVEIRQLLTEQSLIDRKISQDKLSSLIVIPAIKGETLDQQLLRLHDKIEIIHKNLELSLKYRRKVSKAWENDEKYAFSNYRSVKPIRRGLMTGPAVKDEEEDEPNTADEKAMYKEAKELANFAAVQQSDMRRMREKSVALNPDNAKPIAVSPKNPYVSFLSPEGLSQLNEKLSLIKASTFDLRKTGMLKEPLLGEINPELINKTITRNKFQLQLCFELALRRNQNLQGSMEWQWRLDSRGRISDIELLDTTISDRRMIRCVRKKIANWRFPRPRRGSVEIKYPFYFAPAKG